jgi:energy-converting hydrogenase Eha subunit G
MIGGALLAGPIAGTLDNFGVMMAIGTFAGIISALYFAFLHNKINRNSVFDTYGVLYIFIISLLGTLMVAPLVLRGMRN